MVAPAAVSDPINHRIKGACTSVGGGVHMACSWPTQGELGRPYLMGRTQTQGDKRQTSGMHSRLADSIDTERVHTRQSESTQQSTSGRRR